MLGHRSSPRRGAATLELAVLSPLLVFITLVTVDFGRFARYKITIEDAVGTGALYGSGWDKFKVASNQTDSAGIYAAAAAEIQNNLGTLPSGDVTITSAPMTDVEGYAAVTVVVTVKFRPLFQFIVPGFVYSGQPVTLTENCQMRVRPRQ